MKSNKSEELMRISFGPQHPMSGQFRFLMETDGERVSKLIPDLGFTHRGIEKILENRTFLQGIVPVERLSMVDTPNMSLCYTMAVEELMDISPPKRAQYIRTILCEIGRINSHLYAFGLQAESAGGYPAVFLWTVADRELFLDLAEMLTGARWSYSFIIPGGVRRDIPKGFKERAFKTLDYFEERLKVYKECWLENEIFQARSKGVGILKPDDALKLGATGPSLRGSGIALDVRKDEPYAAYEEIEFNIATRNEGDAWARLMVRWMEMVESTKIIRQALENMPEGPVRKLLPTFLRPKKGEAYSRVESARGEIGIHMISDGSEKPYRVKICSPTLRNLYVFEKMPELTEVLVADAPVILYSFDPWYLDADR